MRIRFISDGKKQNLGMEGIEARNGRKYTKVSKKRSMKGTGSGKNLWKETMESDAGRTQGNHTQRVLGVRCEDALRAWV